MSMDKERPIEVNFRSHVTKAMASPHEDGYYAHSEHFGMKLYDDQREDSPTFDETSPITWRYTS